MLSIDGASMFYHDSTSWFMNLILCLDATSSSPHHSQLLINARLLWQPTETGDAKRCGDQSSSLSLSPLSPSAAAIVSASQSLHLHQRHLVPGWIDAKKDRWKKMTWKIRCMNRLPLKDVPLMLPNQRWLLKFKMLDLFLCYSDKMSFGVLRFHLDWT